MMELYAGSIASVLYWVCLAVWRTLPIFTIVLLIDLAFGKRIPPRYSCLLWMLVVARLLLPVSAPSPIAISSKADAVITALFVSDETSPAGAPEFDTFTFENSAGESVTIPILPVDVSPEHRLKAEAYAASLDVQRLAAYSTPESQVLYNQQDLNAVEGKWEFLFSMIAYSVICGWIAGVLFFASRGFVSHLRFAWKLRSQPLIDEQPVIDRLLRACDAVRVGRRPKLKQVAMVDSPAIFGLWRPVLCLPENWREQLSGGELDWVFKHELVHVKRRDGLVLFIAAIARSLHWFHPISWIAFSRLRNKIEQAADETATRGLTDSSAIRYGEVLLRYAELGMQKKRPAVVGLLAMASSRDLRHRIEKLRSGARKRRWLTRICLLPVIVCIAGAGLTDARTPEPQRSERRRVPDFQVALEETNWTPFEQSLFSIDSSEPEHEVQVNVARALEKAEELQPGIDAESFVKTYFATPHLDTAIIDDGVLKTKATNAQERLMREMLVAFEQAGLCQVVVECRLIESDVRLLSNFNWNGNDEETKVARVNEAPSLEDSEAWQDVFAIDVKAWNEPSPPVASDRKPSIPVRATRIGERDFEIFIRRCYQDQRSNILLAPKVTLFNGQSAMISDVVQRPFVTDVSVVKGDSKNALQPEITVLEEGWTIRLKPQVTEQGDVAFQCVFTDSQIGHVQLANLPLISPEDPDADVTVQVPTVNSESISVQTCLSEDDVLLVFSPKPYAQESESDRAMGRVFAIRTTLIRDENLADFVPKESRKVEREEPTD